MSNQVIRTERAGDVFGVPGRFFNVVADPISPAIIRNQKWMSEARPVKGYGTNGRMTVEIRFDDECGNRHNSFAITAEVVTTESSRRRDIAAGGCMHDEIAAVFPELAPLIRWHLCSTDGPMHYIANAVYLAGDRDCHGLRAGEVRQLRNGKTGLLAWRLAAVVDGEYKDARVTGVETYVDAETQPAAPAGLVYAPWNRIGEGKERELDKARGVAKWPEATDEQLSAEPAELKAMLTARLPALINAMRDDVTRAGFLWSQE